MIIHKAFKYRIYPTAWQRCFKRLASAPKWKRKGCTFLGFREQNPKSWRLDGSVLRFPKIGNMRAVIHRPLDGKPKSCTIKRDGDHGKIIPSPRYYEKSLKQLARAQRSVSRKQKGSQNQKKASVRVMRLHRKVRRQREHFLHNLSAAYSKSHGMVVIEKLQIGNMVKANRGLSRGILDAGWGILASQLRYKMAWSGGQVVDVPAYYSSQTCSQCGCVDAKSRRSQSEFVCTTCGHTENADTNAAKVLLCRANRSVLLGEGSVLDATLRTKKRIRVSRRRPKTTEVVA